MSKTSVCRIVHGKRSQIRKAKVNPAKCGRRKILTSRDRRKLSRSLIMLRQENPNFTVMDVVKHSGIPQDKANYRTFYREIRIRNGYAYRQSRKKGILTKNDLKVRRQFARSTLNDCSTDYWTNYVAFYLDGCGLFIRVSQ